MAELFLSNARFFWSGSMEIVTSGRLSKLKCDTKTSKRYLNIFWSFLASILPIFFLLFTKEDANAGANVMSTADFYFLYQQIIGFLSTGLKIAFDSLFAGFSNIIFWLISFLTLIFLAATVTKKLRKKRKEEHHFRTQKYILERKRGVFLTRRFFITFSRFLS